MIIIGVDFHPEFQQIALLNTTTGEVEEKRLAHPDEPEKYYRALATTGETVRIGMKASGHGRWFERLVAESQFELWIGHAAEIRAKRGRRQKTDRQDAQHILKLMLNNKSEMALFSECTDSCAQKLLHTADIVRDAIYRQLTSSCVLQSPRRTYTRRGHLQV